MKRKVIIFDLDDTLFDYVASEMHAVKIACQKQGIEFNENIYRNYKIANDIAKQKVPNYILRLSEFRYVRAEEFLKRIDRYSCNPNSFLIDYLEASKLGVLIPGVLDTVQKLHRSFVLIAATNGSDCPRKNKLESSTIFQFFSGYFSSEALSIAKPSSAFFKTILNQLEVSPVEAISVGDSYYNDILPAIEIGMTAVWFNWKNNKLDCADPLQRFAEIMSFPELYNLLEEQL